MSWHHRTLVPNQQKVWGWLFFFICDFLEISALRGNCTFDISSRASAKISTLLNSFVENLRGHIKQEKAQTSKTLYCSRHKMCVTHFRLHFTAFWKGISKYTPLAMQDDFVRNQFWSYFPSNFDHFVPFFRSFSQFLLGLGFVESFLMVFPSRVVQRKKPFFRESKMFISHFAMIRQNPNLILPRS